MELGKPCNAGRFTKRELKCLTGYDITLTLPGGVITKQLYFFRWTHTFFTRTKDDENA